MDRLPFPDVLTPVDFEATLADFKAKLPTFIPDEAMRANVLAILASPIEGDPLNALLQTFAYYYMTKVGEENDKAKALMLPYAYGTTLEILAWNLYGVSKLEGETDDELRDRAILAWEALSTAGPYGAYTFHTRSAHPRVKDVNVLGPESGLVDPGQVMVVVLSKDANGAPSPSMISAVVSYLNADDRRPLTDQVLVQSASILTYSIEATLRLAPGPDHSVIREAAKTKLAAYVAARHKIGAPVPVSGLHAALTVEGVEQVVLTAPLADIVPTDVEAPFCSGFTILTEEAS